MVGGDQEMRLAMTGKSLLAAAQLSPDMDGTVTFCASPRYNPPDVVK